MSLKQTALQSMCPSISFLNKRQYANEITSTIDSPTPDPKSLSVRNALTQSTDGRVSRDYFSQMGNVETD